MAYVEPSDIAAELDLAQSRLVDGTFVDQELRDRHTDLLFEIPAVERGAALVYVLLEHQSAVDQQMPWRLLRYITRIWERFGAERGGGRDLPEIIPVVLYHGQRPWTAPATLEEMLEGSGHRKATTPPYVRLRYILLDLNRMTEADLAVTTRGDPPALVLAVYHLKMVAFARDVRFAMERCAHAYAELMKQENGWEQVWAFFSYPSATHRELSPEELALILKEAVREATGEDVMPHPNRYVEALLQEGREAGREEGRQEGRQEGETRAHAEVAMRLIRRRFPDQADSARSWVENATPEQLESLVDRIFEAQSIDDLLAG